MSAKDARKKYKLVAPDGGWGYMIIVAVTLNLTMATMYGGSFGVLYKEFMDDVGMSSTHVTTIMGVSAMCSAVSGFMTHHLLSFMSTRMLLFLATLLYNIGVIVTAFVNAIFPFYVTVGIIQAIGHGVIYNLSFTILNEYFVQRRLMAISISQTVIALATMIAPMFVKWLLEEFGYRGTLLLISGITMNNLVGVALIQPVEHHMKKVEIPNEEINDLSNEKESLIKTKIPSLKLTDVEGNVSKENKKVLSKNEVSSRLKKILDSLVDESLRKKFLLSCVSLGPAFTKFADMIYILMLPQALYAAKWNKDNVALALSLLGFSDLAMRMLFIFGNPLMLKLGSEQIYIIGIIIALIARLGTLWSKSLVANLIFISLTGVAHCSIAILIPLVIADAVPPPKFTAAMGSFMMLSGVVNLIFGPAIDAVRDLSESYGAAFYLITSCFAIVALFWLIELCYKKNKHKRLQRIEYLKQKKTNKN